MLSKHTKHTNPSMQIFKICSILIPRNSCENVAVQWEAQQILTIEKFLKHKCTQSEEKNPSHYINYDVIVLLAARKKRKKSKRVQACRCIPLYSGILQNKFYDLTKYFPSMTWRTYLSWFAPVSALSVFKLLGAVNFIVRYFYTYFDGVIIIPATEWHIPTKGVQRGTRVIDHKTLLWWRFVCSLATVIFKRHWKFQHNELVFKKKPKLIVLQYRLWKER